MKDKLIGSLITIVIVLAAAGGIWAIFFRPAKFETAVVKKSDLQEVVAETGTVISNRIKGYYAEQDTRIVAIHSKIGDRVAADAALLTVEYPAGESGEHTATAEFTGILTDINVEEGALVPAGTKLFTIEDDNDILVSMLAAQNDMDKISVSQNVEITLNDKEYKGTIHRISAMAVPASGKPKIVVDVKVSKPDKNILPGEEAEVEIYTQSKESVVVVPVEAIYSNADHDFVYVLEDSKVLRKTVEVGITSKSFTEITDGLVVGDIVITGAVSDSDRGKRAVSAS